MGKIPKKYKEQLDKVEVDVEYKKQIKERLRQEHVKRCEQELEYLKNG